MASFDRSLFTFKLYYFNIPGKGEPCRLALTYAGIEFEDVRPNADEFKALKEDGTLLYGQMPALEVTSTASGERQVICQSAAILRFIGRISPNSGLYPSDADPFAASLVDSVLDEEIDLFTGLAVSKYRTRYGFECIGNPGDALFDQVRHDLNSEVIPRHLSFLEKLFKKSSTGWVCNSTGPTIADFCLAPRLGWLSEHGEGISKEILKPYPNILAFLGMFYEHPVVKGYYITHEFKFI